MSSMAWPLLLLAFALILLFAEVFIPSGGMIGVLAAFSLGYSLWLAFGHSYSLGVRFSGRFSPFTDGFRPGHVSVAENSSREACVLETPGPGGD